MVSVFPLLVKLGPGTLTTKEFVAGLVILAMPPLPALTLVLGVEATVAVVTTVPCVMVIVFPKAETIAGGTLILKELPELIADGPAAVVAVMTKVGVIPGAVLLIIDPEVILIPVPFVYVVPALELMV